MSLDPDELIEYADLVKKYALSRKAGKPIRIQKYDLISGVWKDHNFSARDFEIYREKPQKTS